MWMRQMVRWQRMWTQGEEETDGEEKAEGEDAKELESVLCSFAVRVAC